MPLFCFADLNGEPKDIPSVRWHLEANRLHDLGAAASAWPEGVDKQPTSWAHNSKNPTRIDVVLANGAGLGLVR
eukprot:9845618-Alexandrium_andersonii.AAC.1